MQMNIQLVFIRNIKVFIFILLLVSQLSCTRTKNEFIEIIQIALNSGIIQKQINKQYVDSSMFIVKNKYLVSDYGLTWSKRPVRMIDSIDAFMTKNVLDQIKKKVLPPLNVCIQNLETNNNQAILEILIINNGSTFKFFYIKKSKLWEIESFRLGFQ